MRASLELDPHRYWLMSLTGFALGGTLRTTWLTHSCSHCSGRMIYSLTRMTSLVVPTIGSTPSSRTQQSVLQAPSSVYSTREIRARQHMFRSSFSRFGYFRSPDFLCTLRNRSFAPDFQICLMFSGLYYIVVLRSVDISSLCHNIMARWNNLNVLLTPQINDLHTGVLRTIVSIFTRNPMYLNATSS
jgi:hypothetical protein